MNKATFEKRKRVWFVCGGLLLWGVWISGIFGNSGLIQMRNLAEVKRDMTLRIKALENEKLKLTGSLSSLEHDPLVQEQAIRETLGFVRSGELVFEFR